MLQKDQHVEIARLQGDIAGLLGIPQENIVFNFKQRNETVRLDMVTINPKHEQSFLFHSTDGTDKTDALRKMVEYIQDRYPAAYPSKAQTEAVNDYLRSVYADGDGSMSERNREHRRIASQNITIAAIRVLDSRQLDRLQDVLDHIAYDREYYMPERGHEMHR